MAEAILADALARLGVAARVRSAGTHAVPGPPSPGATVALRARALDCSGHRSRRLRPEDVQSADLVLGMTRAHVAAARAAAPDRSDRVFLAGELARLGAVVGPRRPDEPAADWVARVARCRPDPCVPARPEDEVPDPAGGSDEVYRATAERLAGDLGRVARLLGGARD